MREATPEELKSVNDYIKSISYNPIVKELEEIKAEIQTKICQSYTGKNEINMIMNYAFEDAIKIIDNHIKELKGENNG